MSTLRNGDEHMHYSDNSHRWIAPPGIDQDVWEERVRAHMEQHLLSLSGSSEPDDPRDPLLFIPRPRRSERAEQLPRRSERPKAYVGFRPR